MCFLEQMVVSISLFIVPPRFRKSEDKVECEKNDSVEDHVPDEILEKTSSEKSVLQGLTLL